MMRLLNDYECMLVHSTCNVGLRFGRNSLLQDHDMNNNISDDKDGRSNNDVLFSRIRNAWGQCVAKYALLQVKLLETGESGVLGPRYRTELVEKTPEAALQMTIRELSNEEYEHTDLLPPLLEHLVQVGISSLDVGKGTFFVDCVVTKDHVQIVISLSHALSDGPGALRVAARFLEKLRSKTSVDDDGYECACQPMIDLQSLIVGDDYSGSEVGKDSFAEVSSFTRAVQGGEPWRQTAGDLANYTLLPPEALQDIPHDAGFGSGDAPMRIRAVRVSLHPQKRVPCSRLVGRTVPPSREPSVSRHS